MSRTFGTKSIPSPEALAAHFDDYVEWAHNNPWIKKEAIKSGDMAGQLIDIPHERPLTEWEFAAYLGISYRALCNYGSKEGYEDYFPIYAQIKTEMVAQRVSGGLVDVYNAGLVARIDGLSDKKDVEHSGGLVVTRVELPAKKEVGAPVDL